MPDVKYEWDDTIGISAFAERFEQDVKVNITERLEEIGQKIIDRAKELSPTGAIKLRESYDFQVIGQELNIWNDVPYFGDVEAKVGMLAQAYSEFEPEIIEAVANDSKNIARLY